MIKFTFYVLLKCDLFLSIVFWQLTKYHARSSTVHQTIWPSADPNRHQWWLTLQTIRLSCQLLILPCGSFLLHAAAAADEWLCCSLSLPHQPPSVVVFFINILAMTSITLIVMYIPYVLVCICRVLLPLEGRVESVAPTSRGYQFPQYYFTSMMRAILICI